jgi:hypothetical protein
MIGEVVGFLTGSVDDLDITGIGDFKLLAKDLIANNVHIESVAANSEMTLNAKNNLQIHTIGKSKISYYGTPAIKRNNIGTSSLEKM